MSSHSNKRDGKALESGSEPTTKKRKLNQNSHNHNHSNSSSTSNKNSNSHNHNHQQKELEELFFVSLLIVMIHILYAFLIF